MIDCVEIVFGMEWKKPRVRMQGGHGLELVDEFVRQIDRCMSRFWV